MSTYAVLLLALSSVFRVIDSAPHVLYQQRHDGQSSLLIFLLIVLL